MAPAAVGSVYRQEVVTVSCRFHDELKVLVDPVRRTGRRYMPEDSTSQDILQPVSQKALALLWIVNWLPTVDVLVHFRLSAFKIRSERCGDRSVFLFECLQCLLPMPFLNRSTFHNIHL